MKIYQKQQGFTLVEMLIVLLIISILVIVTIPNVTKHFATIDEKGCDAYVRMVQAQIDSYHLENPGVQEVALEELKNDYFADGKGLNSQGEFACPDGTKVEISGLVAKQVTSTPSANQ